MSLDQFNVYIPVDFWDLGDFRTFTGFKKKKTIIYLKQLEKRM